MSRSRAMVGMAAIMAFALGNTPSPAPSRSGGGFRDRGSRGTTMDAHNAKMAAKRYRMRKIAKASRRTNRKAR